MSLWIKVRRFANVVILELSGRVSVREPQLKRLAEELAGRGERYFIIDLSNVSYIDNAGLGQLCMICTLAQDRGGQMKLLKPTPRIQKLLRITGLDTVFETFHSEAEALDSVPFLRSAVSA